jgi:hypothetical protein
VGFGDRSDEAEEEVAEPPMDYSDIPTWEEAIACLLRVEGPPQRGGPGRSGGGGGGDGSRGPRGGGRRRR